MKHARDGRGQNSLRSAFLMKPANAGVQICAFYAPPPQATPIRNSSSLYGLFQCLAIPHAFSLFSSLLTFPPCVFRSSTNLTIRVYLLRVGGTWEAALTASELSRSVRLPEPRGQQVFHATSRKRGTRVQQPALWQSPCQSPADARLEGRLMSCDSAAAQERTGILEASDPCLQSL